MTRSVPNNPLTLGAISSRRGHIPMRVQRRSLGTIMVYTSLKKTLDYLLCSAELFCISTPYHLATWFTSILLLNRKYSNI